MKQFTFVFPVGVRLGISYDSEDNLRNRIAASDDPDFFDRDWIETAEVGDEHVGNYHYVVRTK